MYIKNKQNSSKFKVFGSYQMISPRDVKRTASLYGLAPKVPPTTYRNLGLLKIRHH